MGKRTPGHDLGRLISVCAPGRSRGLESEVGRGEVERGEMWREMVDWPGCAGLSRVSTWLASPRTMGDTSRHVGGTRLQVGTG